MEIVEALRWLDSRLDHESMSTGVVAGDVEGLSLDTMNALMRLLGDPQSSLPVIHITGTNGKGTVALIVSAILQAHGLSVGLYTSPHDEQVNERISRNGQPISDVELAEVLSGVASVETLLDSTPSWFEVMTAAAFRWFAEAPVDVAVVEVGLLGRHDATNVADATVAVVTSVQGDHTDFAPGWELQVASEKAGIISAESTAVIGEVAPDLVGVFQAEGPTRLVSLGKDFDVEDDRIAVGGHLVDIRGLETSYEGVFVPLHGSHQIRNAAVAVATVEAFFARSLDVDLLSEALAGVKSPGRFEVLGHGPLVIIDGAHNADALLATAETLDAEFTPAGSRIVVFGMLEGRRIEGLLGSITEFRPDLVICTSLPGSRGIDAGILARAFSSSGLPTEIVSDPGEAVLRALGLAAEEDLVVATGSFRMLAPARWAYARFAAAN